MSGKSTLLRTVGVNAVLAFAGAPVRASASPLAAAHRRDTADPGLAAGGALAVLRRDHPHPRLADSRGGTVPLLFLLDELFHGTNSHDRARRRRRASSRSLLDRGAIGLITTHDLALTAIADDLGAARVERPFRRPLRGRRNAIRLRMKPGPVTRSNAIALMRAVGLDVQE